MIKSYTKERVSCNLTNNVVFAFVLISIFILPFVNVLNFALPVDNVFGKSTWLVIPVLALMVGYIWRFKANNILFAPLDIVLLFVVALAGVILAIRYIAFDELNSFLNYRYFATSLIYLAIASYFVKNKMNLRVMSLTIVAAGLAVAVVEAVNFNFFPSVMLSTDDAGVIRLVFDGEKTRSMLLGASISGNQIVCSMFVLVAMIQGNIIRMNIWVSWSLLLFMTYGVSLGESRYPLAVAICLLAFNFFYQKLQHKKIVVLSFLIVLLTSYVSSNFEYPHISRINEDSGGRVEKAILGFKILSDSMTNFSIGAPSSQTNDATEGGYGLSDNSYLEVAISFGVPFATAFFFIWFYYISKNVVNNLSLLFFGYLVVGLSLTNCILWESWLCLAMFSMVVVGGLQNTEWQGNDSNEAS
ncbi:MAG: hypothetical protein B7Y56_12510 [Gallionellales bacterium 35-53-114]|jgi:predicted ester cyclase|nr:MAG: hypothetical protein B7Y56_12510 [Gallionellales bacterium 35-53-114]OYZ63425.1 MAG: hypothetical protein B7Y04_08720 [Gallionellales bacterium 24-53-125]OZB10962.1 MAG: hypothetical protein B7X61_00970 [Gallionellales bacterium 39-52-133]HQS58854.1 hypothetical protein [Gallionellaceae bacterium]HQS75761.1 hypothetical protein [Gallionellaceae bacterium]